MQDVADKKLPWVTPTLTDLDVRETLTGAVAFPFEIFDGKGSPVGGPPGGS